MKHVKLFEAWDQEMTDQAPAQLLATGEWTGILNNPNPLVRSFQGTFIPPATFHVTYIAPGGDIPSGYEDVEAYSDMEDIAEEVFGGDQNGANVAPQNYAYMEDDMSGAAEDMRKGIRRILIDPSIDPSEIAAFLSDHLREIEDSGAYLDVDADTVSGFSDDESALTPEFVQAAKERQGFPRSIQFK
jgi:hypothetical protein